MKVKVGELKVGDIITGVRFLQHSITCKVVEICPPVYEPDTLEPVFPVMVDGFLDGERFGWFKLSDNIDTVDLIYRENPSRYVTFGEVCDSEPEDFLL